MTSTSYKNKYLIAFIVVLVFSGILSLTNNGKKIGNLVSDNDIKPDTQVVTDESSKPVDGVVKGDTTEVVLSVLNEKGYIAPIHGDGETSLYRIQFGREEVDIQSKRLYEFSNPRDVAFQFLGVDAHSSQIIATKDTEEIFSATIYDHTSVAIFAADPLNFIQKEGHTIMIHTGGIETHEVQMFRATLKILNPTL